jgi:hypothetical protein
MITDAGRDGFAADGAAVVFSGLCADCRAVGA